MMDGRALLCAALVAACAGALPGQTPGSQSSPLGGRPAVVHNPPSVSYAPLLLYDGTWEMKSSKAPVSEKPTILDNDCVRTGAFVVCEQNVAGRKPMLDVFTSAGEPGRYYAQPLNASAMPMGRGDLTIDGDVWTYSSQDTKKGKTTYYRTINEFSDGNEKIKYRIDESSDGRTWKTDDSGVEALIHH